MVRWRKSHRQNSCDSDHAAESDASVLLKQQHLSLFSAGHLACTLPQRSPDKGVCRVFHGQVWHSSALQTKKMHGAGAWSLEIVASGRVSVGGKGKTHTWQQLLPKGSEKMPSGCDSLGWGWHGM